MFQRVGSFFSTWSVLLRDLKPWLRLIQRLRFANNCFVKLEQCQSYPSNKSTAPFKIITGAVDSHLNADKYIVPGLGDYGDRFVCQITHSKFFKKNFDLFGQVLWNHRLIKGQLHATNFQCFEINTFTPALK